MLMAVAAVIPVPPPIVRSAEVFFHSFLRHKLPPDDFPLTLSVLRI
jgi:hypothetical protein